MEKLGQKHFAGHKCNLCFCLGYQKSVGTDSETSGNSQSRQDVEEQILMRGPEDVCNQEAQVKLLYFSLQKDLSTWSMGLFLENGDLF